MNRSIKFFNDIIKTSHDMWIKGWTERNAGNITLRLKPEDVENNSNILKPGSDWVRLAKSFDNIGGEFFLVSGTGRYLRNIEVALEKNIGIIELDGSASRYRIVWGLEGGGNPTSELLVHLGSHSVRKAVSNDVNRAVIHSHSTNLIALTNVMDLDTISLTKLLWEMHSECIVVFPEGVEFLKWSMPGGIGLAEMTAGAFRKRKIIVWQFHGTIAAGRNFDEAFGLIDTAEKSAEIYLKAVAAGGIKNKLTKDNLKTIAKTLKLDPDKKIFA